MITLSPIAPTPEQKYFIMEWIQRGHRQQYTVQDGQNFHCRVQVTRASEKFWVVGCRANQFQKILEKLNLRAATLVLRCDTAQHLTRTFVTMQKDLSTLNLNLRSSILSFFATDP